MVLVADVELVEVAAPAPNAYDEVGVVFGVLLRVEQTVAVDGVELHLMSTEIDESLDEHGNLLFALVVAEDCVVNLHGEGAAVGDALHIKFGKGLNGGKRTVDARGERGGEAGGVGLLRELSVGERAHLFCRPEIFHRTARARTPMTCFFTKYNQGFISSVTGRRFLINL